jgi:hypothetical protein
MMTLAILPRPLSPAINHGTGAAGWGLPPACPPQLARAARLLSSQRHIADASKSVGWFDEDDDRD